MDTGHDEDGRWLNNASGHFIKAYKLLAIG
jgi:hypothetical protein